MTAGQDFHRLGDEILQAYEERHLLRGKIKGDFSKIKQETSDLLGAFSGARAEMTEALRSKFHGFETDRAAQSKTRQAGALGDAQKRGAEAMQFKREIQGILKELESAHREMGDKLESDLKRFMDDFSGEAGRGFRGRMEEIRRREAEILAFKGEVQIFLNDLGALHREMGAQLKGDLHQFMGDLSAESMEGSQIRNREAETRRSDCATVRQGVQAFIKEIGATRMTMERALRAEMVEFEEERKAGVQAFLDVLKTEHVDMAEAWQGVLAKIRTIQGHGMVGDASDTVTPPDPTEEAPQGDPLKLAIAQTLKGHSEGLKMTQIAEVIGIDNWRMLIPIMRDLQDTGAIRKEGSLYFSE